MISLFTLLIFLTSLLGSIYLVKRYFKLSFTTAPIVTFAALMAVLYIANFIGFLFEFALFTFVLGLSYAIYRAYIHIVKEKRSLTGTFFEEHSRPLLVFVFLFFINWIIYRNYILVGWDEFSFWGYFVKILLSEHDMIAQYNEINKADYPRITSIFQYYFNLFISGGRFNEGLTIFAHTTLLSSALPIFLPRIIKKNLFKTIIIFVVYFVLFYLFVEPVYLIYNDNILGLFTALAVIVYLMQEDKKKGLRLSMIFLFCLPVIKEIGIVFALSSLFIIALDYFLFRSDNWIDRRSFTKILVAAIGLVVLSKLSWSTLLHYNNVQNNSFDLKVSDIKLNNLKDFQKTATRNYLDVVTHFGDLNKEVEEARKQNKNVFLPKTAHAFNLNDKISAINKVFNLQLFKPGPDSFYEINLSFSVIYWGILFLLLSGLLFFFDSRHLSRAMFANKWNFVTIILGLIFILFAYSVLLWILYLYSFGPYESVRLASYSRYIGTMLLFLFLILLFVFSRFSDKKVLSFAFFFFILAFTPASAIETFAPRHTINRVNIIEVKNDIINPLVKQLQEETPEANVLFVDQTSMGGLHVQFKYLAFPLNVSKAWSFHPKEKITNKTRIVSKRDFQKYLRDFDYIVIWNDKEFWESYGTIVEKSRIKSIWKIENKRRFVKITPRPKKK